jgi:hypothetical protein
MSVLGGKKKREKEERKLSHNFGRCALTRQQEHSQKKSGESQSCVCVHEGVAIKFFLSLSL